MLEPLHIYGYFHVMLSEKNLDEFITHFFSGCINPCLVVGILREKRYPCPNLRNFEYIDKFKESLKILLNPES